MIQSQDAIQTAERILSTLSTPFHLEGYQINITTSIGIAFYPDDGYDVEDLIKNADIAMYKAKEGGKDNYQFFDIEMSKLAKQKICLETDMRKAIEHNISVIRILQEDSCI